jgi:4-hydroxy-3-methylbut-2-enyl diphosphate reductase
MVDIEIDKSSGFCFGVVNAIKSAERELETNELLYSLGDLVHNSLEMKRLEDQGLSTINHNDLISLRNTTVLLRAHGEPPSTYNLAKENNITLVDATCPVVLNLQRKIYDCYLQMKGSDTQLIIYGKKGHAEVNGLVGQTEGTAIVIDKKEDLEALDFSKDIILFSQTTKPLDGFWEVVNIIERKIMDGVSFKYYDTICRQVASRLPKIREFASKHDRVYFVAGKQSSNGKMLFDECLKVNPNVIFISGKDGIVGALPENIKSVGVCGATSTPKWLMEEVAAKIKSLNS